MKIAHILLAGLLGLSAQRASAAPIAEFFPVENRIYPISTVSGVSADGTTVVGGVMVFPGRVSSHPFRWTRDEGLRRLGGDAFPPGERLYAFATAASPDGSVIVGGGAFPYGYAFRWTAEGGAKVLEGTVEARVISSTAHAVSANGGTVVGKARFLDKGEDAFRWTGKGGYQDLGFAGTAYGVSANGKTIVGGTSDGQAFRWTEAEGRQDLASGIATAISPNGRTIVGAMNTPSGLEAFRWTTKDGLQGLGDLAGGDFRSQATAVSADGRIVVGFGSPATGGGAFIWDAAHGMRGLQQLLIDEYGLDETLRNWRLDTAVGVSADGQTIVGSGRVSGVSYPFDRKGWLVEFTTVPEPGTLALLGLALIGLAGARRVAR